MTESDLKSAVKEAMKSGDTGRRDTLRMVIAAAKNKSIELKQPELSDGDLLAVVRRELKQTRESLGFARDAERADDIAKLEAAEAVLEALLPKQLSADELRAIVQGIIAELDAANMGVVMKALGERHAGLYDGKAASSLVRELLAADS